MGCACGNKSGASATPSSFQVRKPDGSTVAYRTKVEAQAAASRLGGKCVNC